MSSDDAILFDATASELCTLVFEFLDEIWEDVVAYHTETGSDTTPRQIAQETWDLLRDGSFEHL